MNFTYNDIYPDSMGESLAAKAAVDGENQDALNFDNNAGALKVTDKAKSYNITMALVSLIVLIILLQMTR